MSPHILAVLGGGKKAETHNILFNVYFKFE